MSNLDKLVKRIDELDEINKINEIIDTLNSGVSITVDTELNESSENPAQNKVIMAALNTKQDILTAGTGISISDDGVISSTGGNAEWGNISGTLSEQTDLQDALDLKQDKSNMVNVVLSTSTDENYPTAKSVYDLLANAEYQLNVVSDTNERLVLDGMANQYDQGNFIPKGTVIHVELDGSGDFTNLNDAVDYLIGKYSNGEITIELGEGTFNVTKSLVFTGRNFNIPRINIKGKGIDITIIKWVTNTSAPMLRSFEGGIVDIADVTVDGNNKAFDALNSEEFSILYVKNVKIINCPYALGVGWNSKGTVNGKFYVENCTQAIECQNHAFLTFNCCDIQFKNVNLGFSWFRISEISIIASTYIFTNVTTRAADSINTYSTRGICQADNSF